MNGNCKLEPVREYYKFYSVGNDSVKYNQTQRPWRWPFIDVFPVKILHHEPEKLMSKPKQNIRVYQRETIFPLKYVPFNGLELPIPNKFGKFITQTYYKLDLRVCAVGTYKHRIGKGLRDEELKGNLSLPCNELFNLLPFTFGYIEWFNKSLKTWSRYAKLSDNNPIKNDHCGTFKGVTRNSSDIWVQSWLESHETSRLPRRTTQNMNIFELIHLTS